MRIANVGDRAALVVEDTVVDVHEASEGLFGPDPMSPFENWDEFTAWAPQVTAGSTPLEPTELGPAVPRPRQVFAIGLNYRGHAEETGSALPAVPATFTKFPASISGPFDDIEITGDTIDWEVELVVVMARRADRVVAADAWEHVAGLTIGQDVSDRTLQFAAGNQFSLGKSRRGFAPIGPWVVTLEEFANPDDLALGCSVDGETVQDARTSDLIFGVPRLIEELSGVLPLLPGDIIFTGTPAGVGFSRAPARALRAGNTLETWIEGIGRMRNRCV